MQNLQPQILGALIGAGVTLIASIVVLIFTNRGHNWRQKQQNQFELQVKNTRLLREKIEDIYLSFSKWQTGFASIYLALIGYVKGELSEKDSYDLFKNIEGSGHIEKVEMLISMYLPTLSSKFENVKAAREKVTKYFPPNQSLIGDYKGYINTQKSFEKSASEFKKSLVNAISGL